jgi:hypothetical protein
MDVTEGSGGLRAQPGRGAIGSNGNRLWIGRRQPYVPRWEKTSIIVLKSQALSDTWLSGRGSQRAPFISLERGPLPRGSGGRWHVPIP